MARSEAPGGSAARLGGALAVGRALGRDLREGLDDLAREALDALGGRLADHGQLDRLRTAGEDHDRDGAALVRRGEAEQANSRGALEADALTGGLDAAALDSQLLAALDPADAGRAGFLGRAEAPHEERHGARLVGSPGQEQEDLGGPVEALGLREALVAERARDPLDPLLGARQGRAGHQEAEAQADQEGDHMFEVVHCFLLFLRLI